MKILNIIKGLAIAIFFLAVFAFASYSDSTRPLDATVTNIDGNIITLTDGCGDNWEWEATNKEHFTLGESVTMIMDMNCTPHTWWDDEIVRIKHNK